MSNEILKVVTTKPDLIEVLDADLSKKIDYLLTEDPSTSNKVLPMGKISAAKEHLLALKEEFPWIEAGVEDALWARTNQFLIQPEPSAWLFGNHMIIQAPYALTLSDQIAKMDKKYFYSIPLAGWVVNLKTADIDQIEAVLFLYGISISVNLADAIEGRAEWRSVLSQLVEDSLAEGIELPDPAVFLTNREYKPWQRESILAMAYQGTSLLTDQVGLGKGGSFVGTSLAVNQFRNGKDGIKHGKFPVVIAVTKSMKEEIGEEVLKWWSEAQVEIINGAKPAPLEPGKDFYIINHDIISNRVDDLIALNPLGFIADECHVYKNDASKRTVAAHQLSKHIIKQAEKDNVEPFIIMASGTPFLNAPIELWSLLEILGISEIFAKFARSKLDRTTMEIKNPKFDFKRAASSKNPRFLEVPLTDKGAFEYYFCDAKFDKFHLWQNKGAANVKELHKLLIDTGMVRRRKSDVMHPLPKLTENVIKISMTENAWAEYERLDEEFRDWAINQARELAKTENISIKKAVMEITRKLDNGEAMMRLTKIRQWLGLGKVDGTVEWIHKFMAGDPEVTGGDETRQKLIVFVHHQDPRKALIEHPDLQKYGILTILPGGDQSGDSIQQHKRMFQKDDRYRLMICSMAAREGHTLTAAKDVYLHEIPFVPSWVVQMAGRCWARLSEDFPPHDANIHYAVVDGTEDPRLLQMNRIKKATFNAVIDGEGQDELITEMKSESVETLVRSILRKTKEVGVAA